MNDTRTASMLQRVPQILAVTAGSYGLQLQAGKPRKRDARAPQGHDGKPGASASRKPESIR